MVCFCSLSIPGIVVIDTYAQSTKIDSKLVTQGKMRGDTMRGRFRLIYRMYLQVESGEEWRNEHI
jgi:hypothetical protein